MDLDRGVLARIDRKLLAGLGQDETYRMVRVPATAAKWATWKRYCDSAGISMGRAIAALIDRELASMFRDQSDDHLSAFAEQAEEELARRREQIARREEKAAFAEERLRAWDAHLRTWEGGLETRERRFEFAPARRGEAVHHRFEIVWLDPVLGRADGGRTGPRQQEFQVVLCRDAVGVLL
jgi:hypothetical protein